MRADTLDAARGARLFLFESKYSLINVFIGFVKLIRSLRDYLFRGGENSNSFVPRNVMFIPALYSCHDFLIMQCSLFICVFSVSFSISIHSHTRADARTG